MPESPEDKISRVRMMAQDNGGTWDLSPNDQAALKHVIAMIEAMGEELSNRSEHRPIDEINRVSNLVAEGWA